MEKTHISPVAKIPTWCLCPWPRLCFFLGRHVIDRDWDAWKGEGPFQNPARAAALRKHRLAPVGLTAMPEWNRIGLGDGWVEHYNEQAGESFIARKYKPEPLRGKDVGAVMRLVSSELDREGIDYWMAAGTVLGIHRDGSPIGHDDDIDIEAVGDDFAEHFSRMGRCVLVRTRSNFINQVLVEFAENIIVDIVFWKKTQTGLQAWTGKKMYYPDSLWTRRSTITFEGRSFPCISPDAYCEYVYGSDWKTPANKKGTWATQAKSEREANAQRVETVH